MSALKKQLEEVVHLSQWEPLEYITSRSEKRWFAVFTRIDPTLPPDAKGNTHQEMHQTSRIEQVIAELRNKYANRDVWISQAEFFAPSRQSKYIARLNTLFCDIDTYATNKIQGTAEEQTAQFLQFCRDVNIPEPSHIVWSGRGLQSKWLLTDYVNDKKLDVWKKLQLAIQTRLIDVGGDRNALDASRILRLVGSINLKSNDVVRVTHASFKKYAFESIAQHFDVHPTIANLELEIDEAGNVINKQSAWTKTLATKKPKIKKSNVISIDANAASTRSDRFKGFILAQDRLFDLVQLARLRNKSGAVADGHRDIFIFIAAVLLVQAHLDENIVLERLQEIAHIFAPHWSKKHIIDSASAALKRLRMRVAGETITFQGQNIDPRYFFKNSTLIEWLAITEEEQKKLKTIISKDEAQKRDTQRATRIRREKNIKTYDQYLDEKVKKRQQALEMRELGLSWKEIAEDLGYKNAQSAKKSCVKKKEKDNKEHPNTPPTHTPPASYSSDSISPPPPSKTGVMDKNGERDSGTQSQPTAVSPIVRKTPFQRVPRASNS